jgi:hypothetical protein
MKKADNFNPGQWLIENKLTNQSKLDEIKVLNPVEPPEEIKSYLLELIQIYGNGNNNEYNEGQKMEVGFEGIAYDDWDMEPEQREEFKRARNYLKKNGPTTVKYKINYTFSTDGEDITMNWIEPNWEELNEIKVNNPYPPKNPKQLLDYYIKQIDLFNPEKINNFNKLEDALENDKDFNELNIMQQSSIRDRLRGYLLYLIDMER